MIILEAIFLVLLFASVFIFLAAVGFTIASLVGTIWKGRKIDLRLGLCLLPIGSGGLIVISAFYER